MAIGPSTKYDLAVIGAGPVGSFCAYLHARKGARVALLEANENAAKRLAGEWLHPPAVETLREAGISLEGEAGTATGKGFIVFPEDGSNPINLPYAPGTSGLACEHKILVSKLREAAQNQPGVDFFCQARARSIKPGHVAFTQQRNTRSLNASRIVGADGRTSAVRKSLGLPTKQSNSSRMVGLLLDDVNLPKDSYGHVILGAPGPILMYAFGNGHVRVMLDVPLSLWHTEDRAQMLLEKYNPWMPESLRKPIACAVASKRIVIAPNDIRLRTSYGTSELVLVGDAAGNFHPLTAVGLTNGLGDVQSLAEHEDFEEFALTRLQSTQTSDFLALGLYEIFADQRPESAAVRATTYKRWRTSSAIRSRTMAMLACQDTKISHLATTFGNIVLRTVIREFGQRVKPKSHSKSSHSVQVLLNRLTWFLRGTRKLRKERKLALLKSEFQEEKHHSPNPMASALLASMPNPRLINSKGVSKNKYQH